MTRKAEIKEFQNCLLKSYSEYIKLRPMIVTLLGSGSFGMHIFAFAFGKKLKINFINIWELLVTSQVFTQDYIYCFQKNTSIYSFISYLKPCREKNLSILDIPVSGQRKINSKALQMRNIRFYFHKSNLLAKI